MSEASLWSLVSTPSLAIGVKMLIHGIGGAVSAYAA